MKLEKGYTLTANALKKKGTTLIGILSTEGWLLSGDTLLVIQKDDGSDSFSSSLKVGKTNDRFVCMMAGGAFVSEILHMEVRHYLVENEKINAHACHKNGKEDINHFLKIAEETRSGIISKIETLLDWNPYLSLIDEFLTSTLVVVDRMSHYLLVLKVTKRRGQSFWTLTANIQSRVFVGTQHAKSLYNQMPLTMDMKQAKSVILKTMRTAAEELYTGDICTLFFGGRYQGWECQHAKKFKETSKRKCAIHQMNPEKKEDCPKETKLEYFSVLFNMAGRPDMTEKLYPTEVEGFLVFLPLDRCIQVRELKGLIRHGCCGSIIMYPKLIRSDFAVRIDGKLLSDDVEVLSYNIEVLVPNMFDVTIYAQSLHPLIVSVNEMTTIFSLKKNIKEILGCSLDGLSLTLESGQGKLLNKTILYDLYVRWFPSNEHDLLWTTQGDHGLIENLQGRQRNHNFLLSRA